jgi:hypothetical protein
MDWGPYACWVTRNPDNPFALMNSAPGPTTLTQAWLKCSAYKLEIPAEALAPPLMLLALGLVFLWIARGFKAT